jgi:PAS domain S-box-containing protein
MSEDRDGKRQPKPLESNDEELARVKSESLYRILFDNAADAIAIHDIGGKFLEVNRVLCGRLGYSREELLQMTPADISSPEHAAIFQQRVETLRKSGHAFFETVHVRRDGTTIPLEVSTRLIEYKGKPAVLSFTRDITERKRVENALRQQYSMLEGIINSSDAPIFSVDRQYRYTSFNKAHAAVMKVIYGKDIEIGKRLLDYMTVGGGSRRGEAKPRPCTSGGARRRGSVFWRGSTVAVVF